MHSLTMLHKRKPRPSVSSPNSDSTLTCVLGLTSMSNRSITLNTENGDIVYTAGCTIVLYNRAKQKQAFIINSSRKPITSIAISLDGKNIASGESGHNPKVRVWDSIDKSQVCEFSGHRFSIDAVCFSPNLRFLVSIGSMHDMTVNVWNWRTKQRIATNNICCKIMGIAFSEDGSYFVTVGNRHVKFWYLSSTAASETTPLRGRSGILAEKKNNLFCDVACGKGDTAGRVYAITNTGLLCEFNEKRVLQKWLDLKTDRSSCLAVGESYVIVGCSSGIVRVFNAGLRFLVNFPMPHFLGFDPLNCNKSNCGPFKYADAVALCLDEDNKSVYCIYNDHSFVSWNISDMSNVRKTESFLYHGSSVWAVDLLPSTYTDKLGCYEAFVTCSSDNSVRLWNPFEITDSGNFTLNTQGLLRILLLDEDVTSLCDTDCFTEAFASNAEKLNETAAVMFSQKLGGRCLSIHPCGQFLAVGDKSGNLHVYEFPSLDKATTLEAHDSDVLSVIFTSSSLNLLISSGRDRLIHIFNVKNDFQLLRTIDDHSAAILSVCMSNSLLFSCGADKTIIIRSCTMDLDNNFQISRINQIVERQSFCDMVVETKKDQIICACQDRLIRFYNATDGKRVRFLRATLSDEGSLVKIDIDSTGTFIAASCTNKMVYIWDLETSECVGTLFGHSEVVTDLKFSSDGRWIFTVGAESCIFIWKLSPLIANTIRRRLQAKTDSECQLLKNSVPDIVNSTQIEQTQKNVVVPRLRRSTWATKTTFKPINFKPKEDSSLEDSIQQDNLTVNGDDDFKVNVISTKSNSPGSEDFQNDELGSTSPQSEKSNFSINASQVTLAETTYNEEKISSKRTSFTSKYFRSTKNSAPSQSSNNYIQYNTSPRSDPHLTHDNGNTANSLPSYAAHTSSSFRKMKKNESSNSKAEYTFAGPPSWLQKWNSDDSLLLGWTPLRTNSNLEEKTFVCRCDFTLSSFQSHSSIAPTKRCRTDSASPTRYALNSPEVIAAKECKDIVLFSKSTEEAFACLDRFKTSVQELHDILKTSNNNSLPPHVYRSIEESFVWAQAVITRHINPYGNDILARIGYCLENLKKKPELYNTAISMLDSIMTPLMKLLSS